MVDTGVNFDGLKAVSFVEKQQFTRYFKLDCAPNSGRESYQMYRAGREGGAQFVIKVVKLKFRKENELSSCLSLFIPRLLAHPPFIPTNYMWKKKLNKKHENKKKNIAYNLLDSDSSIHFPATKGTLIYKRKNNETKYKIST